MSEDPAAALAALRRSIDNLDAALMHVLAERFRVTRAVGALKAEAGLPPADPAREAAQEARLRDLAAAAGLDPGLAVRLFRAIVAEVIREHAEIARRRAGC